MAPEILARARGIRLLTCVAGVAQALIGVGREATAEQPVDRAGRVCGQLVPVGVGRRCGTVLRGGCSLPACRSHGSLAAFFLIFVSADLAWLC